MEFSFIRLSSVILQNPCNLNIYAFAFKRHHNYDFSSFVQKCQQTLKPTFIVK